MKLKRCGEDGLSGNSTVRSQLSSMSAPALSRDKAALIKRAQRSIPEDQLTAEEEIKDPMVLEFLGLKDEYSESALEDALIHRLEQFLLELGNDFSFIARQKRLRVGDEWNKREIISEFQEEL